jgi:hypothetical protein
MTDGQLVTTSLLRGECRHVIAADAEITRNGNPCRIDDLKPGTRVRIAVGKDMTVATAIACIEVE